MKIACLVKMAFESEASAARKARMVNRKYARNNMRPYFCRDCRAWHLTSRTTTFPAQSGVK